MSTSIDLFLLRTHIAYFSMEIALRPEIPTYAGGLGVLAGDTARSCADLEIPVVFVTLASRAGYFRQSIDADGRQTEEPDWWELRRWCTPLDAMVAVEIEQRPVWIRPWLYVHTCPHGHQIPVLLLDTDVDQNDEADCTLTHYLYGGDDSYRLKQEIVLGIGGIRILRALGFSLHTYHLNEGHAALLALELLTRTRTPASDQLESELQYDVPEVRARCVFTTHTPVEAGHDQFSYALFERLLPGFIELELLKRLAGQAKVNLTRLALNLAGYVNGVARRHAQTTAHLFPGYRIHAITNGVHAGTWTHAAFAELYTSHFPDWQHEPEVLTRALRLPDDDVWRCHRSAKADLLGIVKDRTGISLDPSIPVLGFARRMTGYKRPLLFFEDLDRVTSIAQQHPFQVVMAGKAHPRDVEGKQAIEEIHAAARKLRDKVTCVFVPGYDMQLAMALTAGADIWLNTPLPPLEASGTSGMKAALNGVLNISVLDGWWIEACIEGVTGWSIETRDEEAHHHAADLYEKLERVVLPLYYTDPAQWRLMMKQTIANIACYFNSQRMMRRYASEAYLR
ncbi:alpha-glucan family phosphorylase [Paraburkholderia sp. NMBU_R16]|uniref:alpha-glucan family phosphorylase n=1 Tax=Paraburkholderia sp. NMBU_R16 TaxID=2698676 RepID=UPI00156703AC|nr:alpha-glucan family phosphorylase [Paraburkholderia sp. NMBU_R16]NRO96966.1 alpha-glucan family phosphorylase [Paraburkholderia sp. NMBU_R16]